MAKLMRESRLRERRVEKQARKDARKLMPLHDAEQSDVDAGESAEPETEDSALGDQLLADS
ncbi:MAG: hypothetical protein ABSC56_14425 [Solirubrobacteraceae bacterium]